MGSPSSAAAQSQIIEHGKKWKTAFLPGLTKRPMRCHALGILWAVSPGPGLFLETVIKQRESSTLNQILICGQYQWYNRDTGIKSNVETSREERVGRFLPQEGS